MDAVALKNDPRVGRLARLACWSAFEALGRLVTLRARCVELGTDTPGDVEIDATLDGGASWLVRAGLGALTANGGVRVLEVSIAKTGADRTRRWRAARDVTPDASQTVTVTPSSSPDRHEASHVTIGDEQIVTCDASDLLACASESLSDGSSFSSPDLDHSQASDPEAARLDLARELWAAGREQHAALAEQMPGVASESWPRKPVGPAKHLLADVVLDLFDLGADSRAVSVARLARAAAEASAKHTLEWHTPTKYFGQWWQSIERPIVQPRSRGSPRTLAASPDIRVMSSDDRAAMRAWLDEHL